MSRDDSQGEFSGRVTAAMLKTLQDRVSSLPPTHQRSLYATFFCWPDETERATEGREPRIKNAPVEHFLTMGAVFLMKQGNRRAEFRKQTEGVAESRKLPPIKSTFKSFCF